MQSKKKSLVEEYKELAKEGKAPAKKKKSSKSFKDDREEIVQPKQRFSGHWNREEALGSSMLSG